MRDINWSDTNEIASAIVALQAQYPHPDAFVSNLALHRRLSKAGFNLPAPSLESINKFVRALYELEAFTTPPTLVPYGLYGTFEGAAIRDGLLKLRHKLTNPEQTLRRFKDTAIDCVAIFVNALPIIHSEGRQAATFRALDVIDVPETAAEITRCFAQLPDETLFLKLALQMEQNIAPKGKKVLPSVYKFNGTAEELVFTYLHNTPLLDLFLTPVPRVIPPYIDIEQDRLPRDSDHPRHHCYQCRRELPPDFAEEPWQELAYAQGPFFHTEHCKVTAINRHRSDSANAEDAYESLVKEYNRAVTKYEQDERSKEEAERQKRQEKEAEELRKGQEAQERREERDHQAWLRDQERAETKWQREQEQLRKDNEAEEERVAAEQADAQQQTANLSVYERLDDTTRCEHTQIVAGSGAGKTTLIEYDILKLLSRPNPPGIVVIDPKGLLIQRLQKLALFHPENGRLRDRLIIVDPAHSPALNMFDTSGFRVNENQTIDIFQYMFASKINALTPKQGTMFAFVARLLLSMKTATIHDLLDVCDDKSPSVEKSTFRSHIEKLDRTSQRFFTNEYFGEKSEYASTKKEVKQRLYGLLRFPQLEAAFTPPKRRVDMFDAIQSRKIVLVNADYDGLSEDGCQLWGRTIIGLTLNAAFARSSIPQDQWHETFVYVDEAQLFMEQEKTPRFLQLAREYRVGITHAHQDIGACLTPKLATTLSGNTAIKYAARIAGEDLKYVARDLKCEPEFIDAQRKDASGAKFACYIHGMTAPISVSIPWKPLESQPQMSADAHRRLVQLNKQRFAAPPETHTQHQVAPLASSGSTEIKQNESNPNKQSTDPIVDESRIDPDAGSHTRPANTWGE